MPPCSFGEPTKEYETLDVRTSLESAQTTPDSWILERAHPFGIDECQLAPDLFPALKNAVQRLPKKGQSEFPHDESFSEISEFWWNAWNLF